MNLAMKSKIEPNSGDTGVLTKDICWLDKERPLAGCTFDVVSVVHSKQLPQGYVMQIKPHGYNELKIVHPSEVLLANEVHDFPRKRSVKWGQR